MTSIIPTLDRAIWFLEDYADLLHQICDFGDNTPEELRTREHVAESRGIASKFREWVGDLNAKKGFDQPTKAARIVCDVMRRHQLPAAVYYFPRSHRFKIAGEGYQPTPTEILVGVYTPDADVDAVAEDFEFAMRQAEA